MKQFNLQISPEFAEALASFMKERRISKKAEAIRVAVFEALERTKASSRPLAFRELLGAGLRAPLARKRRFKSDDDLWS
jgi:hypothetical protein